MRFASKSPGLKPVSRLLAVALLAGTLSACVTGEEFQQGYILDEQALATVRPGAAAQQVLETLGTPSTVSTVGNQSWYYISQRSRRGMAFQQPQVVEQRVTAVYFNSNLRVERVALYGLEDGKVFDFISRTTPTSGEEQSFLSQILRGATPFGIAR